MATDAQVAGLVYTLQSVMEGEAVTFVVHDYDGDWQFLTLGEFTTDDAVLMHPDHLFDADPTLRQVVHRACGRRSRPRRHLVGTAVRGGIDSRGVVHESSEPDVAGILDLLSGFGLRPLTEALCRLDSPFVDSSDDVACVYQVLSEIDVDPPWVDLTQDEERDA